MYFYLFIYFHLFIFIYLLNSLSLFLSFHLLIYISFYMSFFLFFNSPYPNIYLSINSTYVYHPYIQFCPNILLYTFSPLMWTSSSYGRSQHLALEAYPAWAPPSIGYTKCSLSFPTFFSQCFPTSTLIFFTSTTYYSSL